MQDQENRTKIATAILSGMYASGKFDDFDPRMREINYRARASAAIAQADILIEMLAQEKF